MLQQEICTVRPASSVAKSSSLSKNRLDDYLAHGYSEIQGWLHEPAVRFTLALAEIQQSFGVSGPVCEIGVWQGRYLALLSYLSTEPRLVIGVDMFTHVPDRDQQISQLYQNINAWFRCPNLVRIVQKDSKEVKSQDLIGAGEGQFQFISVDGDHTMPGCLHDLRLADQIAAPGGVVAVDDIMNPTCPGVVEAVFRYSVEPEAKLAPFAIVGNKLFMTQVSHCERFRRAIVELCRAGSLGASSRQILDYQAQMESLKIPVQFLGQQVLVHP